MTTAREKSIRLLVAKFVKLVESLNPGERLSISKVSAKKNARAGTKRKSKKSPAAK
ncbi:MAG: hypothetical protein M3N91_05045 [Pseudomonadota bacterium]|nr:hypothetical protein [Pseudomonadota bacterium]